MFLNPWNFYYHSVTSAVNRNRFETTNRDFIKFLKKKKKKENSQSENFISTVYPPRALRYNEEESRSNTLSSN